MWGDGSTQGMPVRLEFHVAGIALHGHYLEVDFLAAGEEAVVVEIHGEFARG